MSATKMTVGIEHEFDSEYHGNIKVSCEDYVCIKTGPTDLTLTYEEFDRVVVLVDKFRKIRSAAEEAARS